MKATLAFSLPDDERDFRIALSGAAAVQLLNEIERLALAEEIRSMIRASGVDVDA